MRNDGTICSGVDTILHTNTGTFAFRGDKYFLVNDVGVEGPARRIAADWPGLPNNIDAAFFWKEARKTYFFKDGQYWRFKEKTPYPGYPKEQHFEQSKILFQVWSVGLAE